MAHRAKCLIRRLRLIQNVVRILVKVPRADVVVLTANHAAQAREVAFRHVPMLAAVRVDQRVVDALDTPAVVQIIPKAC